MTPAMTPAEKQDVLDAAVRLLIREAKAQANPLRAKETMELAHAADRWRRALDEAQREPEPEVAPTPPEGVAGLLAALQRDGSACWKAAGYRSREGVKSAMKRAGVKRLIYKADGTVLRQRRGTYRRAPADGAVDTGSAAPSRARVPKTAPVAAGAVGGHLLGARVEECVGVGACE